jgi:hypothetical protein
MKNLSRLFAFTLIIFGHQAISYAEDGILVVHVTSTEGRALSGVVLSPKGDGSISPPSDRAGRTRIKLTPALGRASG